MLIEELLFEMPKSINDVDFNLPDPKINRRIAINFKRRGEILDADDELTFYKLKNTIGLIHQGTSGPPRLIYYVQWKEIFHKLVGHTAITQVAVWRDKLSPLSQGVASKIFWEFLLPITDVLMTDAMQSDDGKTFWINRIGEAFKHGLRVYYLSLMQTAGKQPPELIEIENANHFERLAREKEFWGREDLHKARKIIISNIAL